MNVFHFCLVEQTGPVDSLPITEHERVHVGEKFSSKCHIVTLDSVERGKTFRVPSYASRINNRMNTRGF